jgi:hypothetical protein
MGTSGPFGYLPHYLSLFFMVLENITEPKQLDYHPPICFVLPCRIDRSASPWVKYSSFGQAQQVSILHFHITSSSTFSTQTRVPLAWNFNWGSYCWWLGDPANRYR